jgi:hypothetical protein
VKVANQQRRWSISTMVFTASGVLTSAMVGYLLGIAGSTLPLEARGVGLGLTGVLAMALAARELGWLSFGLPTVRRQTREIWGKSMSRLAANALWGADLGLAFTTQITYSGPWLLATLAFIGGRSDVGAAMFVVYWLGRAAAVWIAPLLIPHANNVPEVLDRIGASTPAFRAMHVLALLSWPVLLLVTNGQRMLE